MMVSMGTEHELSDDSDLLDFESLVVWKQTAPVAPKTESERNHAAESFEKIRAAYEAKQTAKAVTKPISVGYLGNGSAMFVFALVGSKVVKASVNAYREGPALSRAIEAAMVVHPGCDLVCSPKKSWVTK
jgi:hypothetical protein